MAEIAEQVRQSLPELQYTDNPGQSEQLQQGAKRKHDEDFVKYAIGQAVSEGKAESAAKYLRGKGLSPQLAQEWMMKSVLHVQASAWMTAMSARVISCAPDAARISNPGEDTELYPCWIYRGRGNCSLGIWLPPQVQSWPWVGCLRHGLRDGMACVRKEATAGDHGRPPREGRRHETTAGGHRS